MATLAASVQTLLDLAKTMDPNGAIARVIELLSQTNEVLADMTWNEGNLTTGHRSTVRTGLPTAVWRKLYGGVAESKSTKAQVDDLCGMLEAWSRVDQDLASLSGNVPAFRLTEAMAFIEAMNQAMVTALFYGDTTTAPEQFHGLSPRFSSLSAGNAQNIITGGGSGSDNTSVWLIVWGPTSIFGIYPKGSTAGLVHEDLGLDTVLDGSSNPYRAYRDRFQWKCGIAMPDWRYVVRIPNIDISDLGGVTGTQATTASTHIIKLMTKALHRPPSLWMGRPVFYMNRTIREYLVIHGMEKSSSAVKVTEGAGQFKADFLGVPLRTVDQLVNTETAVS